MLLLLSRVLLFSMSVVTIAAGVVVTWVAPAESPVVVVGCVRAAIYLCRKPRIAISQGVRIVYEFAVASLFPDTMHISINLPGKRPVRS